MPVHIVAMIAAAAMSFAPIRPERRAVPAGDAPAPATTSPCSLACPPDALLEGEPVCYPNRDDTDNSGCNTWPYPFTPVPCGEPITLCGTTGTFTHGPEEHRDTDWYELRIGRSDDLRMCVDAEAPLQVAILGGNPVCDDWRVDCGALLGNGCDTLCCNVALEAGTYALFVSTRRFEGVECGSRYILRLRGAACTPIAVRRRTWTQVKRVYR